MNIFKFGGASIYNAEGVENFVKIVHNYREEMVIVASAMGKTTNALEELVYSFFHQENDYFAQFQEIKNYHMQILNELFTAQDQKIFEKVETLFTQLENYLKRPPSLNCDFEYDQIVAYGELLSTLILSIYLKKRGTINKWVDIRTCLKTDDTYRDARVNWELSNKLILQTFNFENAFVYLTQGFIGGTNTNLTTTLGREGSDYTAAILAYILNASKVMIWKDVPGIMSADPKWLPDSKKLRRISYQEAIELAFYGAKIIHPKTIQPLQNKQIPLQVRYFMDIAESGTNISSSNNLTEEQIPIFIQKKDQILISIFPNDFSFIVEENLSYIFALFARYHVRINLSQNSAISFSVCVDNPGDNLQGLIKELRQSFRVLYNENLELVTIRHYTPEAIDRVTKEREILIEQKSRNTVQFVLNTS